jgi:arabinose-5-phosphate isomerase
MLQEIDRVFRMEIETLTRVRENLDESYAKALELLLLCTGKVVVSGTGKSGIIAHKIASTLTSTGTPAIFLDPGSGMHGDVGILQRGDLLIAISKSGETEELMSMLLYVKKLSVPVISITAVRESSLANNSDQVLWTPVDEEACPLNLAPTSSTTAALVVGDALAMALMKTRGLKPEEFALYHPGGQLGKRLLMTVDGIMRSGESNPTVNAKDSVRQMLSEITSKRCGAVSVTDDNGELVGLVTDFDIRQALDGAKDIFSMGIPDIMMSKPTFIFSDDMAVNALNIMENRDKPFMVLPVLDRETNKVVAMVHLHDLIAQGL